MRHAGYTKRRLDDHNVRACLTGGVFLLEGLMKEVESADILRQLPTDESRVNVRCVEPWASLSLIPTSIGTCSITDIIVYIFEQVLMEISALNDSTAHGQARRAC
jgi:hypothetical protein